MATNHILSDINEQEKEGHCEICGKVTIYLHPLNNKWYCARIKVKKTKDLYKHTLSEICGKTKTGKCKNCGWVRLLWKKEGKYGHWRCNRNGKGKNDRLKAKIRSYKKRKCEKCGFECIQLCQMDIHHKDHNHLNNDINNFQTLCSNCHRLEHIKTYEYLDEERIAELLQRRWSILLGFEDKEKIVFESGHKNTKQLEHKLTAICSKSRTAYCEKCGLVSIIIRTDKKGFKYWDCNKGGKRSEYNKQSKRKRAIEQQFFRDNKKDKCELCGFIPVHERQLDIHHIDENHDNNDKFNLQTICQNCHRLIHYKSDEVLEQERQDKILQIRAEGGVLPT